MYNPEYHKQWYQKNRSRLLPIRRKYNKEYSTRPEVIEKARMKNAAPQERKRRAYYKTTPEGKIAEKRYRENHKVEIKTRSQIHRLRRYGLTPETFIELREKQGDKCAICERVRNGRFHVDHCHKTNKVRGLLCTACNMALGLFKDDKELLTKAIKYLGYEIPENNGTI